jgi:hypothetical protein
MDQIGLSMRIVLAILATWRITHLLSSEDGPGDLVFHVRAKLGSGWAGRLMDCFYCLSLWVAAAIAVVVTRHFSDWALTWLALSAGACLLERATQEQTAIQKFPIEGEHSHAMLRSEEEQPEEQPIARRQR